MEPPLTRKLHDNPHLKGWDVYFGDVRIGHIGQRAGVPVNVEQWGWSCGFYPGMEPGAKRSGTAGTFEAAREAFETTWSEMLPTISESALAEWRHDRDWRAAMAAKRARGDKLDSDVQNTLMRCICGTVFDSWKPVESYPHRQHIYAAQAARKVR
ncbi:hypothetical protein AC629_13460 [Bradyrhizobium sp. NAS80.1]|uniref:hypothetical protein n=1 Tax=Bradyrhizobium sp. NAS80.1 TaxID=1680159 RepID=UPI00095ECB4D|nr:hypothetical protein [Bradyrhizobium sp. NAS80.1]OKO87559.1 hypothetical protein AC629_13460 [Bradyrhizobium sp. NAS80.1]